MLSVDLFFFFSSRRRHTRFKCDWSSDVCSSDLYQTMRAAYKRIFDRFGLQYRAVRADSGAIGGDLSEGFQGIASTGEDALLYFPRRHYPPHIQKAEALAPAGPPPPPAPALAPVATP